MDFLNFLIEDLTRGHNERAKINAMGLIDHPDLDKNKDKRFKYGCYMIQPPKEIYQMNVKERLAVYKEMKHFLKLLYETIEIINDKDLGKVFNPKEVRKEDKTLSVWRLIFDPSNEYAELYQQSDDDFDNNWERGDFIWNLGASNDNIHTMVHAIGHQYFYEVLTDEQADEWKDFYDLRKYRKKNEFLTQYAKVNHREDYAETFAVYVLGRDKINSLYEDEMKVSKDISSNQKILSKFKRIHFVKKKKGRTRGKTE